MILRVDTLVPSPAGLDRVGDETQRSSNTRPHVVLRQKHADFDVNIKKRMTFFYLRYAAKWWTNL